MYVELCDTHFNIMDVDVNTLLALETVISGTNLDNTELKQDGLRCFNSIRLSDRVPS